MSWETFHVILCSAVFQTMVEWSIPWRLPGLGEGPWLTFQFLLCFLCLFILYTPGKFEHLYFPGNSQFQISFLSVVIMLLLGRKVMTNLNSILKSSKKKTFANKGLPSQSYGFSSSHIWMWKLDYKESWVPKNWWFWTMVLEKTLESPLDSYKEI